MPQYLVVIGERMEGYTALIVTSNFQVAKAHAMKRALEEGMDADPKNSLRWSDRFDVTYIEVKVFKKVRNTKHYKEA